jgi:Mrp family chromosome partitioning ATPase
VIGRIASGALLVVESRTTALGAVQQSKDLLIRNQTRLLGVVMNKFQSRDAEFAYGYYGYGYGTAPEAHADDSERQGVKEPPRPSANGANEDR